jgi:hypothetical protein
MGSRKKYRGCYCVSCKVVVSRLECSMAAKSKAQGIKESEDGHDQAARAQQLIRDKFSEAAKMATSSRKRDKEWLHYRADSQSASLHLLTV